MIIENWNIPFNSVFLSKIEWILHFHIKKRVQNEKYFYKSSHIVPACKTGIILYDVPAMLQPLCLAHIKIYDRAIKILSVGRPIYQVWLSQIGPWRAFTLKICTADHSWELVCFSSVGHRPFIARQSGAYRPMIGRPVTDKYIYVHAYYITMLAYHTEMSYLMPLEKQVFTPGTITRTKFIVVKWRNINVIVRVRSRHVQLL